MCGAYTVIVNGERIKGWAPPDKLQPMQAAFVKHDGYPCGYCTPGQICSAITVLDEIEPRAEPCPVGRRGRARLFTVEKHERMSGNLCRCGA